MTKIAKAKLHRLTPREKQLFLAFLRTPTSNLLLGSQFGLNTQVTKNYLRVIYKKFGVKSRLELYVFAVKHRIVKIACPKCGFAFDDEVMADLQLTSQNLGPEKEV